MVLVHSEIGREVKRHFERVEKPRARLNPNNPTSRENREHDDSGHAVYRSWCPLCVQGRRVGGQHRMELLDEEEKEKMNSIVAFDASFVTQEHADTFPVSNERLQRNILKC